MSGAAGRVELVLQADDLGACVPITDGILDCAEAGVVSQVSVMAPAGDAERATARATGAGLALGVHLTLISEWETMSYRPLTAGPSLRGPDGSFPPGLPELRATATPGDVLTELQAQLDLVTSWGGAVAHMESHVGVYSGPVLAELRARTGIPTRDSVPGEAPGLDSVWHLSLQPIPDKAAALAAYVRSLPPGRHMIVAHPARDDDRLRALCAPSSPRYKWACDIRVSDRDALLHDAFRQACAEREVTVGVM